MVQILGAVAVLLIVGLVVAFVIALVQVSRAEHLSYAAKSLWVVGLFLLPVIGMMAWFALKDHWR
jgi:type III secretory pathway component EscS